MKDTNITQEVLHAGLFLIVAAAVFISGWNEPLRYLFMNPRTIAAEEDAMFALPVEEGRRSSLSSLHGTALDRAPYRTFSDGSLEYSSNFDTKKMGTRTESDQKEHMYKRRR